MSDSLKKVFNIAKEMWYIPFLVYFIGFIYIQGIFSPFVSDNFIFRGFLSVVPVSFNLYLFNGLYICFFILVFPILSAYFISGVNVTKVAEFSVIKFKKYPTTWVVIIYYVLLLSVDGAITYSSMSAELPIASTIFVYILLFSLHINITLISIKIQLKIAEIKGHSKAVTGVSFWFSILILILCIYLFGLNTQVSIFNGYKNQKENLEYAQITKEDGSKAEYIKLDISTDFFIGYDINSRRAIYYPIDKLINIQTFRKENSDYQKLYNLENDIDANDKLLIKTVNQYYEVMTKSKATVSVKDAEEFLKLFSFETYTNFVSKSVDIQHKQLKHETYRDKQPQDFFGYDLSVPVLGEEGNYLVYVREYWKGENIDLLFELSANGLIMKIKPTSFNFKL